jgi:RimJ/RimL family protein N-acetyltransferase
VNAADSVEASRQTAGRNWPLVVRRARAEDRDPVLGFASRTWDGWDYIPHAFDAWLDAPDGELLVGAVGDVAEGDRPLDHEGRPLETGDVIAVARVARLSNDEAWLEGIRVDPRVRGMAVATDLQVAELRWAAPLATVVRYATGERNEASHRLGARHGFELLASFRSYRWSADGSEEERRSPESPSGFDDGPRAAATARRQELLAELGAAGLVAPVDEADRWWESLSRDATFLAGQRLYEQRGWTLQELDQARFESHLQRTEVLVVGEPGEGGGSYRPGRDWALAILPAEVFPSEDVSLHLGLLCGEGRSALRLVSDICRSAASRGAADGTSDSLRFRQPQGSPLLEGHEADFAAAGFAVREWKLHILARPLDADHPPPELPDPSVLVIEEDSGPSPN